MNKLIEHSDWNRAALKTSYHIHILHFRVFRDLHDQPFSLAYVRTGSRLVGVAYINFTTPSVITQNKDIKKSTLQCSHSSMQRVTWSNSRSIRPATLVCT